VPLRMQADRGAYFLVIRLNRSLIILGALGLLKFESGWYMYVGSALNGLSARVAHHLRPHKTKRWHIDYLGPRAHSMKGFLFSSRRDIERVLARKVYKISKHHVMHFGSSYCACLSHLFYFDSDPISLMKFRHLLKNWNSHIAL